MSVPAGTPDIPAGNESVDVPPTVDSGGDNNGFNPAWNPLLEKLPTEFHKMIEPTLRDWDGNFQRVQSQVAPWKQFIDQGVEPDRVQQSLYVAHLLETNPRLVYDKMLEQFGEEWGVNGDQGIVGSTDEFEDGGAGEGAEFDLTQSPQYQQLQEQLQTITQFQQSQIEAQERQRIDAEINKDFEAVATKYGELGQKDVEMISAIAVAQNVPVSKAADMLFEYSPRQQAPAGNSLPNIVPPGGGMPSQVVNPANLSTRETLDMVQNILRNASKP